MKYFLLTKLLVISLNAQSQFTTSGTNVYLTNTGNNLAIGGTTASQKLHVHGNILSTGSVMSNGIFSSSGTNDLSLRTNSTVRLFINQSTGNVGIGNILPSDRLTVSGSISSTTNILSPKITPNILSQPSTNILDIQNFSGTSIMYFANNGRIGIGTTSPQETLHINGAIRGNVNGALRISSGFGTLDIGATNSTTAHISTDRTNFYFNKKLFVDEGIISSFDESLTLQAAGTSGILIEQGSGNVAIGTNDPKGYKLAVAGKLVAEEVNVKLRGNWPDYVFDSKYQLPTLPELENYLFKNKHLPNVPSAQDVSDKGIELGEMNKILLQKIEELTLYVIELDKRNTELKREIDSIKTKTNK
ncbi:MAG: hypothetical protein O9340_07900 [Cyclobacteriaceae bacterium]|nr:hypothetical protein [Cyclobacteriaceae bacterium]